MVSYELINAATRPPLQLHAQAWPYVERRAFDFYVTTTSQGLCGPTSSEKDFWLRTLPQVAMAETPIRHGLCALGALHRHALQEQTGHMPSLVDLPMKQYNLAVLSVALRAGKAVDTLAITTMSCLLFAMFESFQGHHNYALFHIKHGLKLLRTTTTPRGLPNPSDGTAYTIGFCSMEDFEHVKTIFLRFVRQIKELGRDPSIISEFPINGLWTQTSFRSIDEASRALENAYLTSVEGLISSGDRIYSTKAVRNQTTEKIEAWSNALDAYVGNLDGGRMTHVARPLDLALSVYRHAFKIVLQTNDSTQETRFDNFIPEFRKIVTVAKKLICTGNSPSPNTPIRPPCFAVSSCPVSPVLYLTCWKCRDPLIRRQALKLLTDMHTLDGLWDSDYLATYASKIIEAEETGAVAAAPRITGWGVQRASDVPESVRLHNDTALGSFLSRSVPHGLVFHNQQEIQDTREVDYM